MSLTATLRMVVEEASQVGAVRREARTLASRLGLGDVEAEKVAIVATEASTNLLKHGGGGTVYLQASNDDVPALELIAADRGTGFSNWANIRTDGFSTTGTAGQGIGAIERNSDYCEFYSNPNQGTVLLARFGGPRDPERAPAALAGLQVAKLGEDVCGDDWACRGDGNRRTVIVADGLGHGPEAAEASRAAVAFLGRSANAKPVDLLEAVHRGIRHTRGAAVGIAELDLEARRVVFAGLGNIAARICEPDHQSRQMVSLNGTAGMETRQRLREFVYPWTEGAVMVLHSDGLTSRWDCTPYPRLPRADAAVIAGVLLRDYSRGNDDATVVVLKGE